MTCEFHLLDIATWPRGQMFHYFSKISPTGYSLTVNIDITVMHDALKAKDKKFFPAYLYLVTKLLNKHIEFKVAYQGEKLGYFNSLTPPYAAFHKDEKTFSLMWTEFDNNFSVFYERYLFDAEHFGHNSGVLCKPELPPANSYTVSCLPWVEFSHFAVHSYENKPYFFPSVEAGKFFEKKDRINMPISITAHHATTDGWHIKQFLDDLQTEMDNPNDWID